MESLTIREFDEGCCTDSKFLSAAPAQRLNNSSRTFEGFSELQGISLSAVGRQLLLSLRDIPSLFLYFFIYASP